MRCRRSHRLRRRCSGRAARKRDKHDKTKPFKKERASASPAHETLTSRKPSAPAQRSVGLARLLQRILSTRQSPTASPKRLRPRLQLGVRPYRRPSGGLRKAIASGAGLADAKGHGVTVRSSSPSSSCLSGLGRCRPSRVRGLVGAGQRSAESPTRYARNRIFLNYTKRAMIKCQC